MQTKSHLNAAARSEAFSRTRTGGMVEALMENGSAVWEKTPSSVSFVSGHDFAGPPVTGLRHWGGLSHAVDGSEDRWDLQAAEKLVRTRVLYQGMTSVMP
jgi:hypothetical protein